MEVAGMITEYNPFHEGHLRLIQEARRLLGADTAVVVCMSGDFVQRGDFAVVRRQARARAAVISGADLVLELPVPWAVSSAEAFADGGVSILASTGIVTTLLFGSECGDTAALQRVAAVLLHEDFPARLRQELSKGVSFPTARERAAGIFLGEEAHLLSRPNDILGVEYCKSLLRRRSRIRPVAVLRQGAGHGAAWSPSDVPASRGELWNQTAAPLSSAAIRSLLRRGQREAALRGMAPAMRACYEEEEEAGRAPVFYETAERAILARLRTMTREEYALLDEGREGLCNRLYRASRTAATIQEVLQRAKTKRYPLSRIRRMILRAYLGIPPDSCPPSPPYLRPLAWNHTGRVLLARIQTEGTVPALSRGADGKKLHQTGRRLFELETRCADLYALSMPQLSAVPPGALWRERPWIAPGTGAANAGFPEGQICKAPEIGI